MSAPLSPEVRAVLAAIREALDVPRAAPGAFQEMTMTAAMRATYVHGALTFAETEADIRAAVTTLAKAAEVAPVNYPTAETGSAP